MAYQTPSSQKMPPHGDDLIHDARQLEPGLAAVDLRREDLAVEVVEPLVEDAHEPDMLAARVLQMGQPRSMPS